MIEIRAWEEIDIDVRRLIGRAIASHKLRVPNSPNHRSRQGVGTLGEEERKPKKTNSRGSLHGRDTDNA